MIKKKFSLEEACKSADYFASLQEIVQTHPCGTARNLGMAIISSFNGKVEEHFEYLELLAQANPDVATLHQRIAESCIYFEKYEKAVVHLGTVVNLEKENLTARFWLCLMYYLVGETDKAKHNFQFLKRFVYRVKVAS